MERLILHTTELLVLACVVGLLLRVPLPRLGLWGIGLMALAVYVLLAFVPESDAGGSDLRVFYRAGAAVCGAADPYGDGLLLNPPTALPVFAPLGLLPFDVVRLVWTVFIVLGTMALIFLAERTLSAMANGKHWQHSGPVLVVLTAALALSFASRYGLALGQIPVFVTLVLLAALWAQARNLPVLAGLLLALATVKVSIMLPFLLLFLRKTDLRAWLALIACCLVLCLLGSPVDEVLYRCRECLENIGRASQVGHINDYTYANASNAEIIGPAHALYRLGLRDPVWIRWGQFAGVGLVGVWLGWKIVRDETLARPAAAALVCCFAGIFLYHRFYDLVVLALPLVYAMTRAREVSGKARWLYSLCVLAIVGALYVQVGTLRKLSGDLPAGAVGTLIEVVVLPYATWLILLALASLAGAERASLPVAVKEHVSVAAAYEYGTPLPIMFGNLINNARKIVSGLF